MFSDNSSRFRHGIRICYRQDDVVLFMLPFLW